MAPPCYADLGKQVRDLHTKGFHPSIFKFEVKTKTASGIKLTTNGQSNIESGKVLGGAQFDYAWPDYGLKYVEKWNTDNQLTVDLSIEDKLMKGLKTSFVSSFNPTSSKKKGTIKTSYKHDRVNANLDMDMEYAGPVVNGGLVFAYKGLLAGYQMSANIPKSKLTANNFTLGYDVGNHVVNVVVQNGQDFGASYYHRLNSQLEGGIALAWSSATKSSLVSLAGKYNVSPDTALKVKASANGELGLSMQQKLSQCVNLTLSSVLDAKNITAGGHRVGMCLEYE